MAQTFFFYDLETSGVHARSSRIMQFAGQRTDANLEPLGEPVNILIKLTDDIVPDPEAVLLTGITPQQTIQEGITEAAFCKYFMEEIVQPHTIFLGYNSVRFDDEFMRFLLYRNFYDSYAWQWKDGCSRWDLLDVVRMTRALRPDGIRWPSDKATGKATNRLELLTKENNLLHEAAHDALSDVRATIAVAQLLKDKQPKLFNYLLELRQKQKVQEFLSKHSIFIYSSGRYSGDYEKTAVVGQLGPHPTSQAVLVYDLRHDPEPFFAMNEEALAEAWRYSNDETTLRLPVKSLQANRVPALAPLGVMDDQSKSRLKIDLDVAQQHYKKIQANPSFYQKITQALELMNAQRDERAVKAVAGRQRSVDEQLYDSFLSDPDRLIASELTAASNARNADALIGFADRFKDARLKQLVPLYIARNFPKQLDDEARKNWEAYRVKMLVAGGAQSRLAQYFARLEALGQERTDKNSQYLIEELRLYGESLIPHTDG